MYYKDLRFCLVIVTACTSFTLLTMTSQITLPIFSKTHNKVFEVILDEEHSNVWAGKLTINTEGYVTCKDKYLLHRVLMKVTDQSIIVDHIDGNRCNNTLTNLRKSTAALNAQNRKKKIGGKSIYV